MGVEFSTYLPARAMFIPHDGWSKLPSRSRVSHRPTTQIQELVAAAYGFHPRYMTSTCRERHIAWPRQIAMYLTRELTRRSLPSIATAFGKKDHTTVLYAVRQVEKRMKNDPNLREQIEAFKEALAA